MKPDEVGISPLNAEAMTLLPSLFYRYNPASDDCKAPVTDRHLPEKKAIARFERIKNALADIIVDIPTNDIQFAWAGAQDGNAREIV